jgi:hypothetical protein
MLLELATEVNGFVACGRETHADSDLVILDREIHRWERVKHALGGRITDHEIRRNIDRGKHREKGEVHASQ